MHTVVVVMLPTVAMTREVWGISITTELPTAGGHALRFTQNALATGNRPVLALSALVRACQPATGRGRLEVAAG